MLKLSLMAKIETILITGGGGYIGSVATNLFLEAGFKVGVVDNFSTGFQSPLELLQKRYGSSQLSIWQQDLTEDLTEVFKSLEPEAVIHYAAKCSVNESMEHPERYFQNNVVGSANLLAAMKKCQVKNLVFSSTCAVYGEAMYVPVDEDHPTNPSNPYGESKLMVEKMIRWHGQLDGLNFVILRYFNVCGATEDAIIGDSKKPSVHLVQNAVRGALGLEDFKLTCPKVNTPDGTPIRDYVNVVDLNKAHLKALEYLAKGGMSQHFNLGTGQGNSVLEIIKEVEKATGHRFDLVQGEERAGEYGIMIASNKKAKDILSWQPEINLEDSIKSLVEWYKRHPNGWTDDK
jgi:UDP-glucose 4-epimerase